MCRKALDNRLAYLERSLTHLAQNANLEERKKEAELKGNLLLTFKHQIPKGSKEVELENIFDGSGEKVKIKLNPGGSGDSYGEIRTKKLFGKNVTIYSKIYSHSSYVRYKFGESDGVSRRVYVYDDGGSDWWGFRIDDTRYADGYYVGKLEYSQLTIGDDFVELKDNNVEYNLNHELSAVSLPVYFSSWCDSYITLDYIYIRKYAPQEPTVNVNSSGIDWVVINISNPNNYALNDFQVKIPNSDLNYLITQKNEPLTIKDLTNGDEGNQPVKSPIPPIAIALILITIPIIALRKLN
jgi:hypothetical protein